MMNVLAAVIAISVTSTASPDSTQALLADAGRALAAARAALVDHFDSVERLSHMAVTLETRIDTDASQLQSTPAMLSQLQMTQAQYAQYIALDSQLDASVAIQLASGQHHEIASVHGADEVLIASPVDGLLQPVAVYVPPSYNAAHAAPLVVLLHGRTEAESDIMAWSGFRDLADKTGAIVVAPYARGDIQYVDPAPADIYETLKVAQRSFNIDGRRTFLAGYSMGGYGVYQVGPLHAEDWAGFLAIAGGPTTEDEQAVFERFKGKPVYVVSGVNDPIIPNSYIRYVARALRNAGIPTGYYEQANGTHSLTTIYPAIAAAWSDMLHGKWPAGILPDAGPQPVAPIHPD